MLALESFTACTVIVIMHCVILYLVKCLLLQLLYNVHCCHSCSMYQSLVFIVASAVSVLVVFYFIETPPLAHAQ